MPRGASEILNKFCSFRLEWGDDMALPTLRKPVSISRPKRGRHGVFAGLGEDEPSLEEFKPSLFSEASTWSQASWTSALSSQPRNMGPFDPEETADMELAPRGWARQIRPVDHRTTDVKRLRPDEAELAEAKRALRGVRPGDWNSEAFAHYKKKLTKEGRWLALPGLVDMVRRTSDEALKAGGYCLPKNKTAQVRLPQKPSVQWVSMESCTEPDPCQGVVPPPLVVSHKTPLEAAGVLGKHFEGHPLIVTFEATEFDTGAESEMKKGQILEGEARGLAQHEMFNCTNLVFSSRAATLLCAKARQSPQERLNAWHDPGVIVADNVVLFRGPAEDGYPFLSQEEQLNLRVLVAGRALKRPWLHKGEQFLNQDDFLAFSHRLNLMTYKALELQEPDGPAPILVLAACGLADAEHRQPRGGIGQALKTWRTMWSGFFEAVVVACGDSETAAIIDRAVNTDVYMKVLQNQPVAPSASQWHWKPAVMQLSYNPVFSCIARKMENIREAPVSSSSTLRADQPRKSGRRASGAGIMFLQEAMSEQQRPAGAILQHAPSRLSLVDLDSRTENGEPSASQSRAFGRSATSATGALGAELSRDHSMVTRDESVVTRQGSMLMTSAMTTGGRPSQRRASMAVGKDGQVEDSRALMDRLAKLRMEGTDHEQQLKDEEDRRNQQKMAEILAKAWGVGGKRISGMVSKVEKDDKGKSKKLGGLFGSKEAEREEQEQKKAKLETMTLDKKRQIDSNAAILGCPQDLKNYIFKQIEREIKMNNQAKAKLTEFISSPIISSFVGHRLMKGAVPPASDRKPTAPLKLPQR
ncbi:unnamed protein product [Durusdinium trenchii]|uniref:Uncharacterized protein n=2 Tax=Durusdinium trenchii TaxID=1381693 RepID=A0ABP0MGR5_9DINO